MKELIAITIPALSLFIYFILSSIEFGASIFSIFPHLIEKKDTVKKYMDPIWETTTVFLVFSLVSLTAFFPGATLRWGTDLFPITFTLLLIFGIRAACILLMHYADIRSKIVTFLYFLTSFCIPSLFGLIMIYFLTGSWQVYAASSLYLLLVLSIITGVTCIATAFFRAYQPARRLTQLVRASATLFLLTGVLFWISITHDFRYLFIRFSINEWTALFLIIAIIGAVIAEYLERFVWVFFALCLTLGSMFWGLFAAHLPYLVYPSATIYSSITDAASFKLLSISGIVGGIIVLPALILLYRLFIRE